MPLGRPWLTLAMDVCSRMVNGFYLTMEAPSRLSTSLCLLHSVFDKSAWLREREIDEPWPVSGLPETLHVDNGADFRSRAFERGARDSGMRIDWRPPGEPHFGGHIERLIGTQMGGLHLMPGSTFSNPQERGEFDSRKHAALTLRELERHIALEIVGGLSPLDTQDPWPASDGSISAMLEGMGGASRVMEGVAGLVLTAIAALPVAT